jgi:hypothetical protein
MMGNPLFLKTERLTLNLMYNPALEYPSVWS